MVRFGRGFNVIGMAVAFHKVQPGDRAIAPGNMACFHRSSSQRRVDSKSEDYFFPAVNRPAAWLDNRDYHRGICGDI